MIRTMGDPYILLVLLMKSSFGLHRLSFASLPQPRSKITQEVVTNCYRATNLRGGETLLPYVVSGPVEKIEILK